MSALDPKMEIAMNNEYLKPILFLVLVLGLLHGCDRKLKEAEAAIMAKDYETAHEILTPLAA